MAAVFHQHYDYLIVGSGLYGCTFAREMTDRGKKCLVIDKRPQLGGNVACEDVDGVTVHKYGPPYLPHGQRKGVAVREPLRQVPALCP